MNTSNLRIILHQIFALADEASKSDNAMIVYFALSNKRIAIETVDTLLLTIHKRDKARFKFARRRYDQAIGICMNTLDQIVHDLVDLK